MNFLYSKDNHFNMANLITFFNIAFGILAIYFLTHGSFFTAAVFAWLGGACDIFDGKIARKYNLSSEFGVQLDSYADFLSFVIVPCMFIYFAVIDPIQNEINMILVAFAFIFYVISGLRRLIQFNINADVGEVDKFFTGVPTPLGAILLWIVYLVWLMGIISPLVVIVLTIVIGYLLNSKIRIPHL